MKKIETLMCGMKKNGKKSVGCEDKMGGVI